ncbi:LIC_10091 family protein [Paraliomyxa miuraensis]|uniref:LIC_10091 family protein n=1 Tax=Paraliomyxa miuraensis TaxID=376150 RepID=UPI002253055B|nr:SUMF1/EgtB/PvdO family nonheme iron enzyme [Paraliomyxa miuraensis]MCX4246956.1 SUMF1/EgtB/PvdO family nonheme iron enzyme [Paraliomyxa miuraensis]
MLRSSLLTALALAGLLPSCHEAATLPPAPEPEAAPKAGAAVPPEPEASVTIVRIVGDEIQRGDVAVATARPASAPGILDEELRPTRVLPELAAALAELDEPARPLVVTLAPDAPVSHVRAVLASAGRPIRVIVDPQPASAEITQARSGSQLHPPPTDGEAEFEIDLPDDRPASELAPLAAAAPSPTTAIVLASAQAPCVEPPTGMRCIPGTTDGEPTVPTFYIDEREVTFADYDACYVAYGCRGRRGAPPRAASASTGPADTRVMPMDPARARAYCAWSGKRVPTEQEAARAASPEPTAGLRCATDRPFLTRFPPQLLEQPRPDLPLPEPPTDEELEIFARVPDDPVEDKKICPPKVREGWHESQQEGGRSEPTCRDPFSYLQTNEPRGFVFAGYIRNLGGAYVGIGSDQNYSYIAAARAQWAWVMDYDPRVVHNHLRLRAFILASPTADDFVALFSEAGQHEALAILDEALGEHPQFNAIRWGYRATRSELHGYFQAQRARSRTHPEFGWLRNDENYRYIRTLYEQGRLAPKAGDLLLDGSMQAMGAAARELRVPVRIYYTSNAPTAWGGEVTPAYRRNVLSLPFDRLSVVLQTTDGGGSLRQKTKWHHNVQWGRLLHERLQLPGYDDVWTLIEGRIPGDDDALTVLGLPSARNQP